MYTFINRVRKGGKASFTTGGQKKQVKKRGFAAVFNKGAK